MGSSGDSGPENGALHMQQTPKWDPPWTAEPNYKRK